MIMNETSNTSNLQINSKSGNCPGSNEPSKQHSVRQSFTEYSLFSILENERNEQLREVYNRRCTSQHDIRIDGEDGEDVDPITSLIVPPRYQMLNLSSEWFIYRLNFRQAGIATKLSDLEQEWRALDQQSMLFIQDVVSILRTRRSENHLSEHCRSHSFAVQSSVQANDDSLSSSSERMPKNLFQAFVWEAKKCSSSQLSLEKNKRSRQTVYQEVDMNDDEIRAMWEEPM